MEPLKVVFVRIVREIVLIFENLVWNSDIRSLLATQVNLCIQNKVIGRREWSRFVGSIAQLLTMCTCMLRVPVFFHMAFWVYYVYCNLILGYIYRVTVIFGTPIDGSALINIFASNNWSAAETPFKMALTLCQNKMTLFWQKAENLNCSDYPIMFRFC